MFFLFIIFNWDKATNACVIFIQKTSAEKHTLRKCQNKLLCSILWDRISDVGVLNHLSFLVISQWAIFAIRNLLEHNTQNQEQIARLEKRGTADYSALRELGFLVEERDGSLLLKTVRKDSWRPERSGRARGGPRPACRFSMCSICL